MLGGIGAQELLLLFLTFLIWAVVLVPYWMVFAKAGFPGWYSLSLIVPFLNIIVLYILAFAEWPIHRELNQMKRNSNDRIA